MELPKDFQPHKGKDDEKAQDDAVSIFLNSDDEMMEKQKIQQLEMEETELVTETAWDIFNVHSRPDHDEFVLDHQNDIDDNIDSNPMPILTEALYQHGLNGLNTGDVIEIIGNAQSGKTQLLYQYLLSCVLPKYLTVTKSTIPFNQQTLLSLNGHHSRSIWIDLHLTFNKNRLKDIYLNYLKRKINKHNHRIQRKPKFNKYQQENYQYQQQHRQHRQHRHTLPPRIDPNLYLNQDEINKMKKNQNLLPIDLEKFLKSTECQLLWKYVESKIILIQPSTPIGLIISIHKIRTMLNELYTNRISTEKMNDNYLEDKDQKYTDQQGKKLYYIGDSDDDENDNNDNDDNDDNDDSFDTILNHRINQILRGDDKGVRMVLIDDINTFFNQLSVNYDRDRYYSSFSSHLMDLCDEYDLFVIMTRFASTKAEKEWLKTQCPLKQIQTKCNTRFTLKSDEYFHNKFAKIDIERKAIFVIFLYRESMKYVDSTTSHPGITNDLYFGNNLKSNEEITERKKFLTGNPNVTREWIQRLSDENQDPLAFIKSIKQQQNVKTFGCEDYFFIRGFIMTKDVYLSKVNKGKQNNKKEYQNAIFEKKIIRFYAKITKKDIIWNMNNIKQEQKRIK